MKDNVENFREVSDFILKDIYVTDELKRKTLTKCVSKKMIKIKPVAAAVLSAVLVVSFGTFTYLVHRPVVTDNKIAESKNKEYKNSADNEIQKQDEPKIASTVEPGKSQALVSEEPAAKAENNKKSAEAVKKAAPAEIIEPTKPAEPVKPAAKNPSSIPESINPQPENNSKTIPENKNGSKSTVNNVLQDETGISNKAAAIIAPEALPGLASAAEPLTVEKAEKSFESKIVLPAYIPDGFKLTDISIPDDKIKCVKLKYSSSSEYFEILQTKSLSKLEGTKNELIGNSKAYISSSKDAKTNIVTTTITWVNNNIQYSLSGSLSEDSLLKIAKTMN